MSTKTSFKRVALVAVAALGLGVLSSVSASAYGPTMAYTVMQNTTLGQQIVGGQATVTLTLDTLTTTNISVSGVGTVLSTVLDTSTVIQSGVTSSGTIVPVDGKNWSDSPTVMTATTVAGNDAIKITSAVAGTTTITATPISASGVPGTAVTKVITWLATASNQTLDHSNAYIAATNSTAQVMADSATAELTFSSTSTATPVGHITVMQFAAADTTTVSTLLDASSKSVTATITGAGAVGFNNSGTDRGGSATQAAAGAVSGKSTVYVYSDGRTGTGIVTISVNGVAIGTKNVYFSGALASYTLTSNKNYIGVGSTDLDTATITVEGFDTGATAVTSAALGTVYATSATTSVATVTVSGSGLDQVVYIRGVAAGTSLITVCNVSACGTTTTVSKTFTVNVTSNTVKTVTMTFDKATYAPGEKMTLTVAAATSAGTPVADGDRTVFTTVPTVNTQVTTTGTALAASVALVDGKASFTYFAPLVSGDVILTGTDIATTPVGGAAITASASVSGGSADAALDAANEATDAAYAAADAADNATQAAVDAGAAAALAQESADAALAAVTDLGIKVTGLLDKLSASLANIYKIIKAIQAKK